MDAGLNLAAFVMLGLLGGAAHCVGMCAPFVMLVSRRYGAAAGRREVSAQLWYTAGRLLTYVALGALAGTAGGVVERAGALVGLQRAAAIVAGTLLVVSAGSTLLAAPFASHGQAVRGVAARLLARVPGHPIALGAMLGLLPCGLLYSAVVAAAATGGPLSGAAALAAFTAGTAPALMGVAVAHRVVPARRLTLATLSHGFVLGMGVWYLWRGISTGGLL